MKNLFVFLTAALCLCLANRANAQITAYGDTGDCLWELLGDDLLYISGNGAMENYSGGDAPWHSYRNDIETLVIREGVTAIGNYAFDDCTSLTDVEVSWITPPAINTDVFRGVPLDNVTLHLPAGATRKDYEKAGWTGFDIYDVPPCPDPKVLAGALYWGLCPYSTLTISGTGTIPMLIHQAFADGKLTTVKMPWGLQAGNIKSIIIAPGITGMEDEVFGNCTALTDVTVGWTSNIPVIVSSDVFPNVPLGNVTLHLPPGATQTAYEAAGWTGFGTVCTSGLFGQGNALTWELCGGTLTISGEGPMPWYIISDNQPWNSLRDKITDIIIAPGITSIGEMNFFGCHNLVSIDIPASVESIGERAFESCDKLETVDLSSASSLTVIGNSAFSGCSGLTTIIFPESLEEIGTYTFYNCSKLESVTLPESLTTIGESAFRSSGLTSVTIPGKTTTIGVDAFRDCSHLETVILTEGVTSIGKDAFNNSGLTSVAIPASVTGIGAGSFSSCTALTDITVQAANADYSDTDGVLFDKTQETLLQYPAGKAGDSYIIPETVTEIGRQAFYDCTALASVTFPPSLEIIETYAFYNSGLTSVTLPSLVKEINMEAFRACAALTSVTIPVSATFLGLYTFSDCSSLTDVKVMWTTAAAIPNIAYGLFGDPAQVSQITLHVPFGTEAFYQAANIWKTLNMETDARTPVISAQPQSVIVEVDGNALLTVTAGSDDGTLSYQWYSNTSDSNTGGTLIADETTDSYTPPTSATGVIWYYVVITNTNSNADTQTADATSNAVSVTVNPAGFKAVTNITGVPATVKAGEYLPYWSQMKNLLGTVVPADATNKLIEWSVKYSGTTNVGYYTEETHVYENGQLIAITEYGFSALKTGIYVLTATITDGLATGTDYTQDFSITVTASTDITAHPQAAGYTIDETPAALSVTATPQNSGTLSYQWYSNTADNNTTGTLITGETVSSYTPPTGTAGTTYYYVEITNTKTGWETTTVTSQTAAITVTTATPPVDAETPVISGQPQSVTVSVNAPASLSVTAGVSDGGALSYQWYSNTSGSNTGGTPITGATVSSYSPSTAATGARWYYVTVTNTNNSASGVKTAGVTSNAAAVTVEAVIPAPATTYTITVAPSANGQVTATPQNAEAGETVTLTITPAEGYEPEALVIHRTNAENETIAPSGEGNVRTFTMPGFAVTVRASFRPTTPTGTEPLAQPTPLSAYVQNGRLYITGLTPGQSWSLYSITGALISNKTPTTSEAELSLPARGIYIIHSGNNTIKVVN